MTKNKTFIAITTMMVRRDIHNLEYDPATQYRFHFILTWFWFLAMIAILFVPKIYAHNIPTLIIQEISLWANFATHLGAMSASLAARASNEAPSRAQLLDAIVDTPEPEKPLVPPVFDA